MNDNNLKIQNNLKYNMDSNNAPFNFIKIITCLHTFIWFQVFQSNTNNLHCYMVQIILILVKILVEK